MGLPVAAHASGNKTGGSPGVLEQKESTDQGSDMFFVLFIFAVHITPALFNEIQPVEEAAVFDWSPPAQSVRLHGLAFLFGRELDFTVKSSIIVHDPVFPDEPGKNLAVQFIRLFRKCGLRMKNARERSGCQEQTPDGFLQ